MDHRGIGRLRNLATPLLLSLLLVTATLALFHYTALAERFGASGAGGCGTFAGAVASAQDGDGIAVMIPPRTTDGAVISKSLLVQGGWLPPDEGCTEANEVFTDTDGLFIHSPITPSGLFYDAGPVLTIDHTGTLTIENLVLDSQSPVTRGGGISGTLDGGAHLLLNRITISNAVATEAGGAIYMEVRGGSTLVISGSKIFSNTAPRGGAFEIRVYDNSHLIIRDTEIYSNTASDGHGAGGRILVESGQVTVTGTTIYANRAISGSGGGISIESLGGPASVYLDRNAFHDNEASHAGAGIYVGSDNITVTVKGSGIISNTAGQDGGGLYAGQSRLHVTNSTVSSNMAKRHGGGIALGGTSSNTVLLNNVTIAYNVADYDANDSGDGGGLWITDTLSNVVTLANTIVATNTDTGGEAPDCHGGGSVASAGYNLVGDGSGCDWTNTTGDQVGSGASSIDPLLGSLSGWPAYHPLLPSSPAVDKGNPASVGGPYPACATVDQRGATRPGGNGCDAGAYEQPDAPITSLNAGNSSPTPLGSTTSFSATASGGTGVVSYAWNLGDGTFKSGQSISHTYAITGVFTAIVTATNASNLLTATTPVTVVLVPLSGLSASNDSPTLLGDPTLFTATPTGGSGTISYTWDLGDGTFKSGQSVSHTYAFTGAFTAIVTATNASNLVTATTSVSVTAIPSTPSRPDIVINEVFYLGNADEDWVELKNTGNSPVNLSGWQFCARQTYRALDDLSQAAGAAVLVLNPGEIKVFSAGMDLNNTPSDLGLYKDSDFANKDSMVDFVQWGAATVDSPNRSSVAVDAGLWKQTSAGPPVEYEFVPMASPGQSLNYGGTDSGGGKLTLASDLHNAKPTRGQENEEPPNPQESDLYLPAVRK